MDKYISQSLKEVCAEIEAQQSWEDEQFMNELDKALDAVKEEPEWLPDDEEEGEPDELDALARMAWEEYQASGICPCGDNNCDGLDWLLDGDDPFEF